MIALIVVLIIIAILAIAVIVLYNNLVQLRNRVDNAWSQIDVQLQRRLDLILKRRWKQTTCSLAR